jgi:hypothetical protein
MDDSLHSCIAIQSTFLQIWGNNWVRATLPMFGFFFNHSLYKGGVPPLGSNLWNANLASH